MRKAATFSLFAALLLGGFVIGAHGSSLWLNPGSPDVLVGSTFQLDLMMDFSGDPTIGGGVDVFYDPNLISFDSYSWAGLGDPLLDRDPDVIVPLVPPTMAELNGIAFGDFGGLEGPALVGTLTFLSLAPGLTDITLAINDSPAGPFVDVTGTPFNPQPDLIGASVNAVPIPGAVWLLGFCLVGIVGLRRRR